MTLEDVTKKKPEPSAEQLVKWLAHGGCGACRMSTSGALPHATILLGRIGMLLVGLPGVGGWLSKRCQVSVDDVGFGGTEVGVDLECFLPVAAGFAKVAR